MNKFSTVTITGIFSLVLSVSACGSSNGGSPVGSAANSSATTAQPVSPEVTGGTGPSSIPRQSRSFKVDFLLFNDAGAWAPEVDSLKQLFSDRGATFEEVSGSDLNTMSIEKIAEYGAIVWPGGVGSTQMGNLNSDTKIRLRQAVQEKGVGWIGFCAGAFVAVAPPPPAGKNPNYGLGVVPGPELKYYYLENELHAAGKSDFTIVTHTLADGSKRDLVWYGGPVVPETQSGVIARYPNGEPSISQTWSGNGFVILSAVHPAAPQSVRDSNGVVDKDGTDYDLAWTLFDAVLKQKELPSL